MTDLKQMLNETDAGIAALRAARMEVPEEAFENRDALVLAIAGQAVTAAAKACVSHWDEFGPEHEFNVTVDRLRDAIMGVPSPYSPTEAGVTEQRA